MIPIYVMANRFLLYEALNALNEGIPIIVINDDLNHNIWLDGVHDIPIVFNRLKAKMWIIRSNITDENSSLSYWFISDEGKKIFHKGTSWYYSYPFWKRTLAKFGLIDV